MTDNRKRILEPGRLRDAITIRRLADTPDGSGGFTRDWTTVVGPIFAEVLGQNGREALIANTLQGVATYKITVHYRTDLRVNDQVLWNGLELNIVAPPVDPWGTRQETQIFADTSAPQEADEGA